MKRNTLDERKKKNQEISKEEIAEDWCFVCKDGGSLRVCDYKGCLKAYHPECVEKEDSFLDSKSKWTCGWHSCFNCDKSSKYHCFCCPNALCQHCANSIEFARVRDTKGFCHNCLKLALLGEANGTEDSDGEFVDFSNRDTFECLFLEYWFIIKKEENLTSGDLQSANIFLKNWNKKFTSASSESESSESDTMSNSEDDIEDEKPKQVKKGSKVDSYTEDDTEDDTEDENPKQVKKRSKVESSTNKTKMAKSKQKFVAWGSEALIQFLKSIGKQTNERLSQYEVASIVGRYITGNNLFDPVQKRKIICDAKLESLFQKKTFNRNKLHDYLEPHFIENIEVTNDELLSNFSDEDDRELLVSTKKKRKSPTIKEAAEIEKVQEAPKSQFASIVEENIKIAFLMKSLVKQLLDNHLPEDFDSKVIGCFVKIRSDPLDYLQKNRCQLVLIRGVKRILQNDEMKVTLQASTGIINIDLDIEKILDVIFTEEELDDLRKRVEDRLIPRPTVVDLELKAKSLHVDITNHAIDKELGSLVNKIHTCNEKGWREELFIHLRRRELLKSPEERAKMIEMVPQVVAAPAEIDMEPPTLKGQADELIYID
ncbi:uncharacterized protein At5g08430-like [Impatiens glandulifera]|uniref:uncharacterized protein At5g08430-like n=1 Tax=Impatiens glandulifera TaxID=253017 RepID=UPI001FB08DC4|nr:uncharacterized protein At5g08430-like [Impatiens glandulifera]